MSGCYTSLILQMERNRQEVAPADVQHSIQNLVAHLQTRVAEIEQAIDDHVEQDPDLL